MSKQCLFVQKSCRGLFNQCLLNIDYFQQREVVYVSVDSTQHKMSASVLTSSWFLTYGHLALGLRFNHLDPLLHCVPWTQILYPESRKYYHNGVLHCAWGPAIECKNGDKHWYRNGRLDRADGPAIEFQDGYKEWYRNGLRERADGPAIEQADGHKEWWRNDKRERPDGPAIEWANGDKSWYRNGKYERPDGPAVELVNGNKVWYRNGEYERPDGPAIEHEDGGKFWYRNGLRQRPDGPAVEHSDGTKEWWWNGENMMELKYRRNSRAYRRIARQESAAKRQKLSRRDETRLD